MPLVDSLLTDLSTDSVDKEKMSQNDFESADGFVTDVDVARMSAFLIRG
jgi:hypothetical protein